MTKFCNSDKYSFCFTLQTMPKSHFSSFFAKLSENQEVIDEEATSSLNDPSTISNQYIHDLYRFFTVSAFQSEAFNIFSQRIALHRLPIIGEHLGEEELRIVADFLFQKERTDEALDIYRLLIDRGWLTHGLEIYQKAGYCLQKAKRYAEALVYYKYADTHRPDTLWTMRHIATCYRMMKEHALAIEMYHRVEAIEPDNRNIMVQLGNCYVETNQIKEAMKYFFKLEFLDENNAKALRGIAWCSFLDGKYEQAMKYYRKLLAGKPVMNDYLNAGHTAWVMKDMASAIDYYSRAVAACDSKDLFLELFNKDRNILLRHGIDEENIPLMLDMV
jgi:tetratricopeptide (TPR) repeat protein